MKTFITILILLFSTGIFSQNLDFMGIPCSKKVNNNFQSTKGVTQAENPVILNSFASPTNLPTDIASDQNNLYVVGYNEFVIFVIDKNTGLVTSTIPIDILKPYGISVNGNYAYVLDNINHKIEKINLQTAIVEDSLFLNTTNSYPTGLVCTDNNLWINDSRGPSPSVENDTTFNIEFNGEFLKGHRSQGDYPTGLAWDGTNLYSTDNVSQTIYKLNPENFEITQAIYAPGGNYPNGLAFDGNNLWLINNASDSIYQIQINQNITSINDFNIKNNLIVYPNPAKDLISININLTQNSNLDISIYDINGKLIKNIYNKYSKKGKLTITTNISELNHGVYLLQAKSNLKMQTKRLIIK